MKNTALLLPVALLLTSLPCAAQGPLEPPGAPVPTMHTLEEIYQRVADLEQQLIDNGIVQVPGMVLIPAGEFVMGATTNVGHESNSNEGPQHTVNISAFYMDATQVTKAKWDEVYMWATNNGYAFDNAGSGKARFFSPVEGSFNITIFLFNSGGWRSEAKSVPWANSTGTLSLIELCGLK